MPDQNTHCQPYSSILPVQKNIFILHTANTAVAMSNIQPHHQETNEFNDDPFELLTNSEELIPEVQEALLAALPADPLLPLVLPINLETIPHVEAQSKEETIPLSSQQPCQFKTEGAEDYLKCQKSVDKNEEGCQSGSKQQFCWEGSAALGSQPSSYIELQFSDECRLPELGYSMAEKEQSKTPKLQAIIPVQSHTNNPAATVSQTSPQAPSAPSPAQPDPTPPASAASLIQTQKEELVTEVACPVMSELGSEVSQLPVLSTVEGPEMVMAESSSAAMVPPSQSAKGSVPPAAQGKVSQAARLRIQNVPLFLLCVLLVWVLYLLIIY